MSQPPSSQNGSSQTRLSCAMAGANTRRGKSGGDKPYHLGVRTEQFAADVRALVRRLPRTISNMEDVRQLIRSSGSVGANWIEADDALGRKDFLMHARICRKEAKESAYWLRMLFAGTDPAVSAERDRLEAEARELKAIFAAILLKADGRTRPEG